MWGGFIIFPDQFPHSWLPQLEEQDGNVLAQLFVQGRSREFSRAGWSSRGTTAGQGWGHPGPAVGPWAEQFLFCHVAVPEQMDTPL